MKKGTIKKLTDKGFGFIETGQGDDVFFHMSVLDGVRFSDLWEGRKIEFNAAETEKGLKASNVKVV